MPKLSAGEGWTNAAAPSRAPHRSASPRMPGTMTSSWRGGGPAVLYPAEGHEVRVVAQGHPAAEFVRIPLAHVDAQAHEAGPARRPPHQAQDQLPLLGRVQVETGGGADHRPDDGKACLGF